MTTEQAYINGFVKRASEYGYNEVEAVNLLKQAMPPQLKELNSFQKNTPTQQSTAAPVNNAANAMAYMKNNAQAIRKQIQNNLQPRTNAPAPTSAPTGYDRKTIISPDFDK
jgi:hypothetical protein